MTSYILKRLAYTVPTIFGVLLLTFLLFNLIEGDVSAELAGPDATPQTIKEVREQYGLNKPRFVAWDSQFFNHIRNALTFDFGRARDREPVSQKIKRGLGPTLAVTVPIFVGTLVVSVSVALIVAALHGTIWDITALVICVIGMSMPYLGFVLLGQYLLAYRWSLAPVFFSPDLPLAQNVALPVVLGIVAGLGSNVRFYRAIMLDQIHSHYVRTAYAKGLSTRGVLFRHVLRNAMIPIIARMSMAVPYLFVGSLLLERFFGIAGLGSMMIDAVAARDYAVINAMTFIGALIFIICDLFADISYHLIDPRVRLG